MAYIYYRICFPTHSPSNPHHSPARPPFPSRSYAIPSRSSLHQLRQSSRLQGRCGGNEFRLVGALSPARRAEEIEENRE